MRVSTNLLSHPSFWLTCLCSGTHARDINSSNHMASIQLFAQRAAFPLGPTYSPKSRNAIRRVPHTLFLQEAIHSSRRLLR